MMASIVIVIATVTIDESTTTGGRAGIKYDKRQGWYGSSHNRHSNDQNCGKHDHSGGRGDFNKGSVNHSGGNKHSNHGHHDG